MKNSQASLITIITVVFNAEKYLESTIQSVLDRDCENIEYIIIDGGSTDGTVDIIEKYQDRINYWISESDRGIYDAMNKGWSIAKENSHILFLGAGDRIEQLPDLSKYAGCTGIFGNVGLGNNRLYKSTADIRIKLGNTLHHQALLVHKSIHISPPFNLNYKAYADYDFNARLYNQGVKFIFDSSFHSYALPGGLTEKFYTNESLLIVKENFGMFWKLIAQAYYMYQNIRHGAK